MKSVIGIDYGTQSARAVLLSVETGELLGIHTVKYPCGVMEGGLASAKDYENALDELLCYMAEIAKNKTRIIGIGVDATSLTLVPLDSSGCVLSNLPEFAGQEHAQIKLWKRHTANTQAQEALDLAKKREEKFLQRTGRSVSSEWMLPKLMEMRDQAPEIYYHMDLAFDLCDFLTYRLTGKIKRSIGSMSYKCLWAADLGFPPREYLNSLRTDLGNEYINLLRGDICLPGEPAGVLRPELCIKYGLSSDVVVAAGVLDGHTTLIALGALKAGDAALVVGTSNVLTVQTTKLYPLSDVCGIALDALTPGLCGIDAGQNCTGDMLEWYVKNALPSFYFDQADIRGTTPYKILEERITQPWSNPVSAVDWWNGSRNAPCDLRLQGTISGLTLDSSPEKIYLALIQGMVCGTRDIIEHCRQGEVDVSRVLVGGGACKSSLLMHHYAEILNMPIAVGKAEECPARGSAILAAVAARVYPSLQEAYEHMGIKNFTYFQPSLEHAADYQRLYRRNCHLRKATIELKHSQ